MDQETEEHWRVLRLSYFSRMTDAQTFADLAEGEMRRRGVKKKKGPVKRSRQPSRKQAF